MIAGGDGNDFLTGGTGKDALTGGAGADKFFWYAPDESGVGVANRDTISDFQVGIDEIHLAGFHIAAEDITFHSIASGRSTILAVDLDHNGSTDFEIQLNNVAFGTIHPSDIVL